MAVVALLQQFCVQWIGEGGSEWGVLHWAQCRRRRGRTSPLAATLAPTSEANVSMMP